MVMGVACKWLEGNVISLFGESVIGLRAAIRFGATRDEEAGPRPLGMARILNGQVITNGNPLQSKRQN